MLLGVMSVSGYFEYKWVLVSLSKYYWESVYVSEFDWEVIILSEC